MFYSWLSIEMITESKEPCKKFVDVDRDHDPGTLDPDYHHTLTELFLGPCPTPQNISPKNPVKKSRILIVIRIATKIQQIGALGHAHHSKKFHQNPFITF